SAACDVPMSCHNGKCSWDLIAACFTTGQVLGLETRGETHGPLQDLGTNPAALASYKQVLLSADGTDSLLYQASMPTLAKLPPSAALGAGPNHLLVESPYVYAINSIGNTLQVLRVTDAGTPDSGLLLATVGELNFG